jgi:phosphate starvation-inducible PhoH-like protein
LKSQTKNRSRETAGEADILQFEDNGLIPRLYGEFDQNLARIEHALDVSLSARGNQIAVSGPGSAVQIAGKALRALYRRLETGLEVDGAEVDAAVRLASSAAVAAASGIEDDGNTFSIRTPKRQITPRSGGQLGYMRALTEGDVVFGIGPAGTGKTYLAVAAAVSMLVSGRVDRIVLSRPAVEAGERLGFLPGDLREKIDPYLAPLYDALYDMMPADQVMNRLNSGEIEVAPLAFMRGRTLSHAFVILDEAQNATRVQLKMFLTRLGEGSRMAVTADPSQVDLPPAAATGLIDAVNLLEAIDGVRIVRFSDADVVRHSLVTRIVRAYEKDERRRAQGDAAARRESE